MQRESNLDSLDCTRHSAQTYAHNQHRAARHYAASRRHSETSHGRMAYRRYSDYARELCSSVSKPKPCSYLSTLAVHSLTPNLTMDSFKFGVQCLRCLQIFTDKSNFNRHHNTVHKQEGCMQFELQVPYKKGDKGSTILTEFDWTEDPLPQASLSITTAAPGLLERETGFLSRAAGLYSDEKWAKISEPCVLQRDEAEALIDEIDDFAWSASVIARTQVTTR